ncbi:MAG: hemolysin III family protein [Bacteroidota bacterium]
MTASFKISKEQFRYELANSLSHGAGLIFGIISIPALILTAIYHSTTDRLIGAVAFGVAFLMVYTFSTLYHSFHKPALKKLLQKLDHISIYYLIAGSYTPFILTYVQDYKGFTVLALVWFMAMAGTIFKVFFTGKYDLISTLIYLAMGWLFLIVADSFFQKFPFDCLVMVISGGLSYTIGVIFYRWESLPYHHAIWHIFVLGGSVCHYFAVLLTVTA